MCLDKFLVTTQFRSMITTHRTVEGTRVVVVERGDREVQHAIVTTVSTLLNNIFVSFRLLNTCNALWLHKHIVVEVTLVHAPHIHQTNDQERHTQKTRLPKVPCSLSLFLRKPPHSTDTQQDEQDAAPSVSTHHRCTHVRDAVKDILTKGCIEVTSIHILTNSILVAGAQTIVSKSWCHHINQADDHRKDCRNHQGLHTRFLYPQFQSPQSNERHHKLYHHQNACHSTEL